MENAPVGPQHPPTCDITDDVSPCKIYMATQNRATRGPEKKSYKEHSKATEQEYGFNNMYASSSRNYQ